MSTTELAWFKSSYSGSGGGNCIEVAMHQESVFVRDSKDTRRAPLTISPSAWARFVAHEELSH